MVDEQDIRRQIMQLDPLRRDKFFEDLISDYWPSYWPWRRGWGSGIEKSADVCGGSARIVRTRIPVWVLQQMRNLKMSEAKILNCYPTLRAEDLVNAWIYADLHSAEIEGEIKANEEV